MKLKLTCSSFRLRFAFAIVAILILCVRLGVRPKLRFLLLAIAFSVPELAFAEPLGLAIGQAAIVVSPDIHEMMALSSFYNRVNRPGGSIGASAHWMQTLQAPNSCSGIARAPDGKAFFVGGGVGENLIQLERARRGLVRSDALGDALDTSRD